jgi:F-type H+-transporting ATPase subunit b
MALLKSLGIDFTLWIHVGCFAVAYLALSNLIFKPYLKALAERESRTVGGEEQAAQLLSEADAINTEYETKAKAVSASIRAEYEKNRLQAMKESEALLAAARMEAGTLLEKSRARIASEIASAKSLLSAEVPSITSAIASKMAGKEISL